MIFGYKNTVQVLKCYLVVKMIDEPTYKDYGGGMFVGHTEQLSNQLRAVSQISGKSGITYNADRSH